MATLGFPCSQLCRQCYMGTCYRPMDRPKMGHQEIWCQAQQKESDSKALTMFLLYFTRLRARANCLIPAISNPLTLTHRLFFLLQHDIYRFITFPSRYLC